MIRTLAEYNSKRAKRFVCGVIHACAATSRGSLAMAGGWTVAIRYGHGCTGFQTGFFAAPKQPGPCKCSSGSCPAAHDVLLQWILGQRLHQMYSVWPEPMVALSAR